MYFSVGYYIKEKKNDVTAWNFSSSYCAFLDFFNIESRGAIVDEAPKAKVDSFSCFLMIRIFFSLQSTSLSILEQELVHSAAFFSIFHPDIYSSMVAINYILQDSAGKLEARLKVSLYQKGARILPKSKRTNSLFLSNGVLRRETPFEY